MFWRSFLQIVSFRYNQSINSVEMIGCDCVDYDDDDDDDGCDCVDDNI